MKKLILALFAASTFMLATATCAHAETQTARDDLIAIDTQWADTQEKLMAGRFSCQERWDVLWAEAKRGSLDARAYLLYELSWGNMHRPGYSNDTMSKARDYAVLAIHSFDEKNQESKDLQEMGLSFLPSLSLPQAKDFTTCLKKGFSQKCTSLAVEAGLIPSFADYVEEVEGALKLGKLPMCLESNK